MSQWIYNGNEITNNTPSILSYGFIYELTLLDGRKYIGSKVIWGKRKRNFTQKEIDKMQNKRLKKWEYVVKESDWRTYTGSSKIFGSKDVVERKILQIAKSKRELTYLETKHLFMHNAIEDDNYLNVQILNKFFRGNLV